MFAHGKVILVGEHAVVHGVPAIAVGIERGVRAVAAPIKGEESRLIIDEWMIEVGENDDRELAKAFRALLTASPLGSSFQVTVEVEIPPGAGLGCSAAVGVATARAIEHAASERLSARTALDSPEIVERVHERAMAWERVFHGNPSGIDTAVAIRGGALVYQRPGPALSLQVGATLHLAIGHSGTASSTKAMVESVARLRERRPEVVGKAFSGIAALSANAKLAIEAGDVVGLGKLLDLNQMLLAGLFLSTPDLEAMCLAARSNGALGAKLTGGGGGGCVVALAPSAAAAEAVLAVWAKSDYRGFVARVPMTGMATERARWPEPSP